MQNEMLRVVISGCSGGGKSTLLDELARRGYAIFEEPGRAIVREQLASGGEALPWRNGEAFAHACIARALAQWDEAGGKGGVAFFDRSMLDAINALEVSGLHLPPELAEALGGRRYHARVFLAPPWPEIYMTDAERRHSFEDAVAEFGSLQIFYARHRYEILRLPKRPPAIRADFVLERLGLPASP